MEDKLLLNPFPPGNIKKGPQIVYGWWYNFLDGTRKYHWFDEPMIITEEE